MSHCNNWTCITSLITLWVLRLSKSQSSGPSPVNNFEEGNRTTWIRRFSESAPSNERANKFQYTLSSRNVSSETALKSTHFVGGMLRVEFVKTKQNKTLFNTPAGCRDCGVQIAPVNTPWQAEPGLMLGDLSAERICYGIHREFIIGNLNDWPLQLIFPCLNGINWSL
jgi:hypothetical protein